MSSVALLRDRLLGSKEDRRRILDIALPAILANSSAPLVGLVDTWAVGHLPGAVHLAAVGLGSVVFNFLFWAFGFLRMGTTGLIAQAHGRADDAEMARTILRSSALAIALGLGLVLLQEIILALALSAMAAPEGVNLLAADYFRIRIWAAPATLFVYVVTGVLFGQGRSRAVLLLQVTLNLANAGLNLWFVIGLGLGVAGVALGTAIAQGLAALLAFWLLVRNPGAARLLRATRDRATWMLHRFRRLLLINGFLFLRTILLMVALTLIMREAALLGEVSMAASHVVTQYMLLISLGLDGFAHAAEALAGAAWGDRRRAAFQRWVFLCGAWALLASMAYAAVFATAGTGLTALLTDIPAVREATATVMPIVVLLPLISVWCFHFDGVFVGATAAGAMFGTMALAFVVYLACLGPLTERFGLVGLWSAVLVFMAARGLGQASWYPRLPAALAGRPGATR